MRMCEIPNVKSLPTPVHMRIPEALDFTRAQRLAKEQARSFYHDAMLLSWYDRENGRYSPHDVECCSDGKPSWVEYANSREGNLTIDINDEEYIFIFRGKPGLS